MGTNYYFIPRSIEEEYTDDTGKILYQALRHSWHIGKKSSGYLFLLHAGEFRDITIRNLQDLKTLLGCMKGQIVDGLIDRVPYKTLMDEIELLPHIKPRPLGPHAVYGPYGYHRIAIGEHCIGHGPTYDIIKGKFS